jgi:hypothetical protein
MSPARQCSFPSLDPLAKAARRPPNKESAACPSRSPPVRPRRLIECDNGGVRPVPPTGHWHED